MGGKDIVRKSKISLTRLGRSGDFIVYKVVLFYNGKQFTFTFEELNNKEVKIDVVIYEVLGMILDVTRVDNIYEFSYFMNYNENEFDIALKDYKNRLKLKEGFKRLYGQDIKKLLNYFGYSSFAAL